MGSSQLNVSLCTYAGFLFQAKLEEERRAATAAREAARAHAKAMAQQREVVRQQQATLLRDKVNARLKQAAERRCVRCAQHGSVLVRSVPTNWLCNAHKG